MDILQELLSMQDRDYKQFSQKLVPNVPPEQVIGVRSPQLRAYAKAVAGTKEAEAFLRTLPHAYHEENMLHAFLIERIRDADACIEALDAFLPYVDNWAVCDCMSPKTLGKQPEKLLRAVDRWLDSGAPYTVRYAIGQLMRWFLDERFDDAFARRVAAVRSDEYYVNMMRAWYFATALAKQYDAVLPYLTENRLDTWTHNKTIQKAAESLRIPPETKAYLRRLKRS